MICNAFLVLYENKCTSDYAKEAEQLFFVVVSLSLINAEQLTFILFYYACMGLVDLARHLLEARSFHYVCLGQFTTDPLEKAFGKLRQGSGGTYFINVQQVRSGCNFINKRYF